MRRAAPETRAQAVHLVRIKLGGAEAEQKVKQVVEVTVTGAGARQTPQGWGHQETGLGVIWFRMVSDH